MHHGSKHHGLEIVSGKGTVAKEGTGTRKNNVRLERAGHIADILTSQSSSGEIFHYVIQRAGSPEIVHWGQERSMEQALEMVNDFLDEAAKRPA